MRETTDTFTADDGFPIHRHTWRPDEGAPRAVVQILHGLAEHSARYRRLAEALTGSGYAVVAHDHRGHGHSVRDERDRGHFADHDGWTRAVRDAHQLRQDIAEAFEGLPVVLLGHSMGSSLALWVAAESGHRYAGMLLSGPTGVVGPLRVAGLQVCKLERWRLGRRGYSTILHNLSFGDFNKGFEGRTDYDWLSRDPDEVDKYADDPFCGFIVTTQHWHDHLVALGAQSAVPFLRRIPKTLPIRVALGDRDPVSQGGKQVDTLLSRMTTAGLDQVSKRYYEGARHEIFNETNRDEIVEDCMKWMDGVVG